MSGLFGIIDNHATTDIACFLASVQNRLAHRPWYVSNVWQDSDRMIGLGRSGIGIFNRETQPISDEDIVLFISGEFLDPQGLAQRLKAASYTPSSASHAELALGAYRIFGERFAAELNGAFFIALYDRARHKLVLANDRFGLYPHYLHVNRGRLVFAPEVKGVLSAPFVPKDLNETAVAEYMRFQHLLGEKTFHQPITLFPYGSIGCYDLNTDQWCVQRYWDWNCVPDRPEVTFEEAIVETGRLLRRAVERRTADHLRPGVFLSGGLDGRTLLGLIPPRGEPPVSATFGVRRCRDVVYAAQIARAVGSRHRWFDMPNGRWVLENVDLHLKLTEGFHNWLHMHGIHMLPDLREVMDYNLTGWEGGGMMGHPAMMRDVYIRPVDEMALAVGMFQGLNQAFTWPGITEAEEQSLYTPVFARCLIGRAFESLREELRRFWCFRRHYAGEYFFNANHFARYSVHMVTTERSHIEVRFPFWDYDLVDYLYSLPPEIRGPRRLYRHVITRETPKLARIPFDKEEFLPTSNYLLFKAHALSVRARKRLHLFPNHPTLYADYENYLRTDLRKWAEDILYDPRTEARGIFNMPFVRSLMDRHMSGREEWTIGKIAPLISFELVMRQLFDES
jgi:asparagine synthase (glutamine-hydrolysing)